MRVSQRQGRGALRNRNCAAINSHPRGPGPLLKLRMGSSGGRERQSASPHTHISLKKSGGVAGFTAAFGEEVWEPLLTLFCLQARFNSKDLAGLGGMQGGTHEQSWAVGKLRSDALY